MKRILTTITMCALLLSLTGCATESAVPRLPHTEDAPAVTDTASAELSVDVQAEEAQTTELTIEATDTAEKEIPAESVASEVPQPVPTEPSVKSAESETPKTPNPPRQTEPTDPTKAEDHAKPSESTQPVETQPEPAKPTEPPKETEQPKPAEPPAPPAPTEPAPTELPAPTEPLAPTEPPAPVETEPPVVAQPKTAYDYEFDINAIRADCIAIGQSMGYTLNTSLTMQNATWWNPVTASESNQGSSLKSALEQYIRLHTVANLGAYGLDEITEFNICCESRGGGSYAIYFVFA